MGWKFVAILAQAILLQVVRRRKWSLVGPLETKWLEPKRLKPFWLKPFWLKPFWPNKFPKEFKRS
jgi:hypothetical protein